MLTAKFWPFWLIEIMNCLFVKNCVWPIFFLLDEWNGCNQGKRAQLMEIRIYQNSRYLCQMSNDFIVFKKTMLRPCIKLNANVVSHIVLK